MACQEMGALYHGKFIFSSGFSDSVHRGFMFSFSAAVSRSSSMYIFSFCVTFIPPCTAGGHLWYNGRNAAVLRRLPGCCAPPYHPPAHGSTARFSVGRVGKIGRRRNPSQKGGPLPLWHSPLCPQGLAAARWVRRAALFDGARPRSSRLPPHSRRDKAPVLAGANCKKERKRVLL